MSKILPHPVLSFGLLIIWLLLNSPSLGHVILGSIIAIVAGRAVSQIEPKRLKVRNPVAILKLFVIVGIDIIRSNIAVAGLVLTNGRHGNRRSAFVEVPLRLRDPVPLAVLAMIITATPGSAWMEFDSESGVLLVHVFDVIDEAAWAEQIQLRYETLLLEIFP